MNFERVTATSHAQGTQFRLPENVITMNPSLNFIGRLTRLVFALSVLTHSFASTSASGCQLVPQIQSNVTFKTSSSRRAKNAPPLPTQLTQAEQAQDVELTLDSSDDSADGSDSMIGPEEDVDDDATDLDQADSDEDEEADDEDDQLEDESDDETTEPDVGPMAINTDTRSLRVNIAESSATAPGDQSEELVIQSIGRDQTLPSEKRFAWAAPDIRYQPLYFENVPHERYGQTPEGCELRQTLLSAAHFFGSTALLPYKLLDQNRHSCDGPLGFCRPGSETPFVWQRHIVR